MNDKVKSFEFLFGGTFDPVHCGHLAIIEALLKLDFQIPIRLMPCAIPALKLTPAASFEQRVDMLGLVTSQYQKVSIDLREKKRAAPSYTVDTMRELHNDYPKRGFILVVGADSLVGLQHWHQHEKLISYCHLLVVNRPGFSRQTIFNTLEAHQFVPVKDLSLMMQRACGHSFLLEMPEKTQSSTEIRQSIANKLELDSMLPQSVIEYIQRNHLYLSES